MGAASQEAKESTNPQKSIASLEPLEARRLLTAPTAAAIAPYGSDKSLSGYTLAWHDEFSGTQLDQTQWMYRTDTKARSTQVPANVSEGNGVLKLTLRKQRVGSTSYTGAGVISRQLFKYGYYEARVKMPVAAGWHTSFWTQKYNGVDTGVSGARQEIDVEEHNSATKSAYSLGLFDWTAGREYGRTSIATPDLSADYHVYGALFTETQVKFFFDGRLVRTTDVAALPQGTQNIWLTSIATSAVDDSKLPATACFSYVRYFAPTAVPFADVTIGGAAPSTTGGESGAPAAAVVQAENFDTGGEGLAHHDGETVNLGGRYRSSGVDLEAAQDADGGYNVGWTRPGEWLTYTVNVATAGRYDIDFRLAAKGGGGTFHLEVDRADVTGRLAVPDTGGWQNWKTLTKRDVPLTAGKHVLRLALDAAGAAGGVANFNYFTFSAPPAPPAPPPATAPASLRPPTEAATLRRADTSPFPGAAPAQVDTTLMMFTHKRDTLPH